MKVFFFVLTLATSPIVAQEDESQRLKRLNPYGLLPSRSYNIQSILDSFEVEPNTIIRTADSINAGARYLNESQKRSSAECSLFCYDFSDCNAAVFEEKNSGACYLFDCGTNGRLCRFTTHSAYTVSRLTTRSRHENELVSLKHAGHGHDGDAIKPLSTTPSSTTTSSTTTTTTSTTTTTTTTTRKPGLSHCDEHQFKCANSSECIAIYDVCNGIPQCSDGSDEAETLDCHARDGRQMAKQVDIGDQLVYDIIRPVIQEKLQEKEDSVFRRPGVYEETRSREYPQFRNDIYRNQQQLSNDYADSYASGRRYPQQPSGIYPQQNEYQSRYEESQPYGTGYYASSNGLQRNNFDAGQDFQSNYVPAYSREQNVRNLLDRRPDAVSQDKITFGKPRYSPSGHMYPQGLESEKQLQLAKSRDTLASIPAEPSKLDTPQNIGSYEPKPRRRPGNFMDEQPPPPPPQAPQQPQISQHPVQASSPPATRKPEPNPPEKQIANMHISVTQVETKGVSSSTSGAVVGLALGISMSALFLLVIGCRLNMRRKLLRWRGGSKKGLSLLAPEDDEDYLVNGMYL
ncbi:uncharacterized protein LOC108864905 [Galendromus occidentalis]|uniref:Uncharacterized protein LOC108864905 n=1 Tax=Galendromus occidentalis TaxID=34638 RepID=A0AAJ7SIT5_9ACAR|nr:uncharacterized protein LOC108864905 [Galendromus occidentalis]